MRHMAERVCTMHAQYMYYVRNVYAKRWKYVVKLGAMCAWPCGQADRRAARRVKVGACGWMKGGREGGCTPTSCVPVGVIKARGGGQSLLLPRESRSRPSVVATGVVAGAAAAVQQREWRRKRGDVPDLASRSSAVSQGS